MYNLLHPKPSDIHNGVLRPNRLLVHDMRCVHVDVRLPRILSFKNRVVSVETYSHMLAKEEPPSIYNPPPPPCSGLHAEHALKKETSGHV